MTNPLHVFTDRHPQTEDIQAVKEEWNRQYGKWGKQDRTLFEWMAYLTEEVGELIEAISKFAYRDGVVEDIQKEATQVAALALKIRTIVNRSSE